MYEYIYIYMYTTVFDCSTVFDCATVCDYCATVFSLRNQKRKDASSIVIYGVARNQRPHIF